MRKFAILALVFVAGVGPLLAAGPFRGRSNCSGPNCPVNSSAIGQPFSQRSELNCGPDGCVLPAADAKWLPSKRENGEGRYELLRNGSTVGFYDVAGEYYREWLGPGQWGPKIKPPIAILVEMQTAQAVSQDIPGGVDREKLKEQGDPTWDVSGVPVPNFELVMQTLEDDSGKLWLVVTGDGRDKFVADMKADPKNKELLARCRVWSVAANDWSILDRDTKKAMFPVGNPGVFLGLPDGRKLFEGSGSIDMEALRRADPNNKPPVSPTPTPNQPAPPPAPKPLDPEPVPNKLITPLCCVAGGIVLLSFLRRR